MRLISFIKETVSDAVKVVTSKERIRRLYGISLYRNAIYLMLNSAVVAATGFIFWLIAARLYSTGAVGLSSAVISAVQLLALFSILGLDSALIRFLHSSGEKARDMINSCFTISGVVAIALSLIFLAGLNIWVPALLALREHLIFLVIFVVFTVALTANTIVHNTFIAERRAGFSLAQGLLSSLLRLIPLVILVVLLPTFGIFASWGIAALVALAAGIFLFLPRIKSNYRPVPLVDKGLVSGMVHFSLANYVVALFRTVPVYVFPLMVISLLGAEMNAYFYISWSIAMVLSAIPMATSLSLFSEGSFDEAKLGQEVRRSLKLTFLLLVPAIIIIFLVGDKILLLFGEAYSENATKLLWLLALSTLPASLNRIFFSIKRVEMRMKVVVGLGGFIVVTTLALSYVLLPWVGIIGVGLARLVSEGIVALVVVYNLWRGYPPKRQEINHR